MLFYLKITVDVRMNQRYIQNRKCYLLPYIEVPYVHIILSIIVSEFHLDQCYSLCILLIRFIQFSNENSRYYLPSSLSPSIVLIKYNLKYCTL